MARLTAPVAALLATGALAMGAAAAKRHGAPAEARPPVTQTPSDYIPIVPDTVLEAYTARQQAALLALREGCISARAAMRMAERERIEARALSKLREAIARQRPWGGFLTELDFSEGYASAKILVAPKITFATADVAWRGVDPLGTCVPAGSDAHRALTDMQPNTLVVFEFEPVSVYAAETCLVEMRLRGILPISR